MSEVGKLIIQGLEEAVTLKQITEIFKGTSLDRLRAIAEAERDGRLVVLPCKAEYFIDAIDKISLGNCPLDYLRISAIQTGCKQSCFECLGAALSAGKGE